MLLHPPVVHFAIVLPVAALVLALLYLIKRDETLSKIVTYAMFFAVAAMGAAWYTGAQAGPDEYPLLFQEGKALLLEHKGYALYLFAGVAVAAVLKLVGSLKKNFAVEAAAVVLLLLACAGTLYQGSLGGKLVYEHGAGVENHSDGMDCIEELAELEAKIEAAEKSGE